MFKTVLNESRDSTLKILAQINLIKEQLYMKNKEPDNYQMRYLESIDFDINVALSGLQHILKELEEQDDEIN